MTFAPDTSETAKPVKSRRLIPVSAPINWQSPFDAYQKVYRPNSFLLESVNGPPRVSRYSIIGLEPHTIFKAKSGRIQV
ncbi:MAG: anthranilate synthase component I, partial [Actinomycetia bacterium]|nr:anthranilate synthase component I [Actinomycetes bacterium]